MKTIAMRLFCLALRLCYLPFRLLRRKNKIVFLSRQSDRINPDFAMLSRELEKISPATRQVILCRAMGKGLWGKVRYGLHMFTQMKHLATARVAVLDGYCIAACVLQPKGLQIFQLWHALGLLKKFGYAAVDTGEGSSPATARIMNMHRGYHRIICSSPALIPQIAPCYDADPNLFLPIGLPRIDFLTQTLRQDPVRAIINEAYPALNNGKLNALYVPTFRKNGKQPPVSPERLLDPERFNMIIKPHSGEETVWADGRDYHDATTLTGWQWIAAADLVITDYSAIIFEALCAGKPVYRFCYDLADYRNDRGFVTDFDEIPCPLCETPEQLCRAIDGHAADPAAVDAFLQHHVAARNLHVTRALAAVLAAALQGRDLSYEQILADETFVK